MAASLLGAMWRLRITCTSHRSLLGSRRLRTGPPLYPVPGDEQDSDVEWEENKQQDVNSALKRRRKAILLKRMQNEMGPPEPAERRLTWNAIEQIRYLRQEFPEEWPLSRLAVGFNVSTDAIQKVLKSKFVPSEARRMKQDTSVFRVLGQNSPVFPNNQLQLGSSSQVLAQPLQGNKRQMLISQSNQLLPPPTSSDSSELALKTAHETKSLARAREPEGSMQGVVHAVSSQGPTTRTPEEPVQIIEGKEDEGILDEKWDGEVLSVKELEELANSGVPNNLKVEQKGSVARILSHEAGIHDLVVLQAALLHDTVEDTNTTFLEIEETFGPEVRRIVEEVTDDKTLPRMTRKQQQIEHAPHCSHKAKLVKLADKLYNLRDLNRSTPKGWSENRVQEYFQWAFQVVNGLQGTNMVMERQLDQLFKERGVSA